MIPTFLKNHETMGSKLWEIRESYGDRMGERNMSEKSMSEEEREAYKCGYEDGYEDAMKEVHPVSERYGNRYMGERGRMRDSMGRYR